MGQVGYLQGSRSRSPPTCCCTPASASPRSRWPPRACSPPDPPSPGPSALATRRPGPCRRHGRPAGRSRPTPPRRATRPCWTPRPSASGLRRKPSGRPRRRPSARPPSSARRPRQRAARARAAQGGTPAQNRALGMQMCADRGWSASQCADLGRLWQRESGWSHRAHNARSGAHGIPQALPGSKMSSHGSDWATSAAHPDRLGPGLHRRTVRQPEQRLGSRSAHRLVLIPATVRPPCGRPVPSSTCGDRPPTIVDRDPLRRAAPGCGGSACGTCRCRQRLARSSPRGCRWHPPSCLGPARSRESSPAWRPRPGTVSACSWPGASVS